ncbi:MAG: hypothetical protein IIY88_08055 [Eubacterium sp.]|nr:hypothetical protein [Eubacterium sp.]
MLPTKPLRVVAFKATFLLPIDKAQEEIIKFCDTAKVDRKDALRHRLAAEECLLRWIGNPEMTGETGTGPASVTLKMGRRMFSPYISLESKGGSVDPYAYNADAEDAADDISEFSRNILVSLQLSPEYSYTNGCNKVMFRLSRKQMGSFAKIAVMVLFALIVGFLGLAVIPDSVRESISDTLISPVYEAFFDLLRCVA